MLLKLPFFTFFTLPSPFLSFSRICFIASGDIRHIRQSILEGRKGLSRVVRLLSLCSFFLFQIPQAILKDLLKLPYFFIPLDQNPVKNHPSLVSKLVAAKKGRHKSWEVLTSGGPRHYDPDVYNQQREQLMAILPQSQKELPPRRWETELWKNDVWKE